MKCPKCNKEMIKRDTGVVLLSYPTQHPWNWWCGGCDFYCKGGTRRANTVEEIALKQWEAAQEEIA